MASSSLSQESLDHDDFEISTRRSRNRVVRNRAAPAYNKNESVETTDDKDIDDEECFPQSTPATESTVLQGAEGTSAAPGGHVSFCAGSVLLTTGDRESPTRSKMVKEKQPRSWPGHALHKAKPAKDKRKLREKRRSSGLVHMQSTEVNIS